MQLWSALPVNRKMQGRLWTASYRVKAEGAGCCGTREFVIKEARPSRLLLLGCLVLVDRWQTPQSNGAPEMEWCRVSSRSAVGLGRSVIRDPISNFYCTDRAAGRAMVTGFIQGAREKGCIVVLPSPARAEAGGSARDDSGRPIPANSGQLFVLQLGSQPGGPPADLGRPRDCNARCRELQVCTAWRGGRPRPDTAASASPSVQDRPPSSDSVKQNGDPRLRLSGVDRAVWNWSPHSAVVCWEPLLCVHLAVLRLKVLGP